MEGLDYYRVTVYFGKLVNELSVQCNNCYVVMSYLAKLMVKILKVSSIVDVVQFVKFVAELCKG